MPRDREHLELPVWNVPTNRRKRGGGRPPLREDIRSHGQSLDNQAEAVINSLESRLASAPAGINPKLLFKLQLNSKGSLDENQLRQMGLRLLAHSAESALVVFPDDSALHELRRHIQEYAGITEGGHKFAYVANIDAIVDISPDDRIGRRLRANPIQENENVALDIELWHEGTYEGCQRLISEIRILLQTHNSAITDQWIGQSMCLLRAKLSRVAIEALIQVDYVKEIERKPEPVFELSDVITTGIGSVEIGDTPPENAAGVLVIDSGVMQGHPLLGPALGDAQVFPDRLGTRVVGGADDADQATGGHGTAVAGIAVYGDLGECLAIGSFRPSVWLFSARVTDNQNEYSEDELVEHQLASAVDYFLTHYSNVKVINISLGNANYPFQDGNYQFRLAAVIDELAYIHREREIVFVISAGNYIPEHLTDEDIGQQYPNYLFDSQARLIDPATSAISLTVGGLSYGYGRDLEGRMDGDTVRLVAGERGWPSPFSRTGWGMGGAIKPELVDYAGDWRLERGRIYYNQPTYAGIPTTAKNFSPPDGRPFRTVSGTSFSAPRVANLAAKLFNEFPDASSNLIRALIVGSARLGESQPPYLEDKPAHSEEILRLHGYGQPDFERARWSASNDVLLIRDTQITLDTFQLFAIPPLPEEFMTTRGHRYLSITLAFDPPTRHTRVDSYLGTTMYFRLYRNVTHEQISEAIAAVNEENDSATGNEAVSEDTTREAPALKHLRKNNARPIDIDLIPGPQRREKGTLQRGIHKIGNTGWKYDRAPLVLAVVCQRKWAPANITDQRFAVVVSLHHTDETLDLYARIRQHTRLYQKVRVRV